MGKTEILIKALFITLINQILAKEETYVNLCTHTFRILTQLVLSNILIVKLMLRLHFVEIKQILWTYARV